MKYHIQVLLNIKRLFNNLKLHKKLFLSSLFIAFIPMLFFFIFMYYTTTRSVKEEGIWSVQQALKQIDNNISNTLNNLEAVSNVLYANRDLQDFLELDNPSYSQELEPYLKIEKQLKEIAASSRLKSAKIFSQGRSIYSQGSSGVFPLNLIKEKSWFNNVYNSNNLNIFWDTQNSNNSICLIRPLKEFKYNSVVKAVIQFEISMDLLKDIIKNTKIKRTGYIFFTDKNGRIIANIDNALIGKNVMDVFYLDTDLSSGDHFEIVRNNKKMMVVREKMPYTEWWIYGVTPTSEVIEEINKTSKYMLFVLIICMLFTIQISNMIAGGISRPVLDLTKQMHNVDEGSFLPIKELDRSDEIGMLYSSFNNMILKIQQLIKEVYETGMLKKEAEFKALQSQINPHFLYNTLDSIHWLALRYKAKEISTMVSMLAKFYRISINKGKEYVTVAEELQHAESYIRIQKIRYENKFDADFEIEDSLLGYKTIKLIIQPLIENALFHGIEKKSATGMIIIRCYSHEDLIIFEVEDNGLGCSIEILQDILSCGTSENKSGYGIRNVNDRIRLYFGQQYGLSFLKGGMNGICARITIPKISEGETGNA